MVGELDYVQMLKDHLSQVYVPHLPVLLEPDRDPTKNSEKNIARALSAFVAAALTGASTKESCEAVIDDFNDGGLDAIHYDAASKTLFLIQSKLHATKAVVQEDALAFCDGIDKLIRLELGEFNSNFQKRRIDIEHCLNQCIAIQPVVASSGAPVTVHARKALNSALQRSSESDSRLATAFEDFDLADCIAALEELHAYPSINVELQLDRYIDANTKPASAIGVVPLVQLTKLHRDYGDGLYAKNIRNFLGTKSVVNGAVRATLSQRPEEFLFLNNGITLLCEKLTTKANRPQGGKNLTLSGVSVINGAQTIASAADFISTCDEAMASRVADARVTVTIIESASDELFAASVTHARNNQNPVVKAAFAALDPQQERLRRQLLELGFVYAYKPADKPRIAHPDRSTLEDSAFALAALNVHPRFAWILKKEPAKLTHRDEDTYATLFGNEPSPYVVANAVVAYRYVRERMQAEELAAPATSTLRIILRHGQAQVAWLVLKALRDRVKQPRVVTITDLRTHVSARFDHLRATFETVMQSRIKRTGLGPLALSRSQIEVYTILRAVLLAETGVSTTDAAISRGDELSAIGYLVPRMPQVKGIP